MICSNKKKFICVLLMLSIFLCACGRQEEPAPQVETYNNLDNVLKKEIFIEKDSNLQAWCVLMKVSMLSAKEITVF